MPEQEGLIVGLGARVHLFVQPSAREAVTSLFRDVLGCQVVERDFGLEHPVLLVLLSDGSRFSVEFTTLAVPDAVDREMDDERAFRGAWIEFRTTDVDRVQAALSQAGVPAFQHAGSAHVYFSAPGGQVFRVLDVGYEGP